MNEQSLSKTYTVTSLALFVLQYSCYPCSLNNAKSKQAWSVGAGRFGFCLYSNSGSSTWAQSIGICFPVTLFLRNNCFSFLKIQQ